MTPTPKGWPRISSAIYYRDPRAAIDWLCSAFGFETRLVVDGDGGRIVHSELVYGGGVVRVAEAGDPSPDHAGAAPETVAGANTQNMFVYVADVEAHCARARAAGAKIGSEPAVSDYGEEHWADKGYECVDPGGHHWWFAERLSEGARYAPRLDSSRLADRPPRGWPRISSSLYYPSGSAAIDWLCQAFGFEIQLKVEGEGGRIEHSELVLADGLVMVADEARAGDRFPHCRAPSSLAGHNTQNLMVYVDDVDAICARARAAGARIVTEPSDSDYGADYWTDRSCAIVDLGGHRWGFAQRLRG